MPGWSSTAPAAMTAVLAAFQASSGLTGVDVRDGATVTSSDATEVVAVGWYGQASDEVAVDGTITMEGVAGSPDRELYVIRCAAFVLQGSGDAAATRARAYALVAACGQALAATRTPGGGALGGLVMNARIISHSLQQVPGPRGTLDTIEFGVQCDGYTTS
jgi:hypothetical protein